MLAWQSIKPGCRRHPADTSPATSFQPHPCGFGGAFAGVGGRIYLFIHGNRPLFTMVGGGSFEVDGRRLLCGRLGVSLDRQVRVPTTLTSDRGTQFCSELWANLCRRLDIQHIKTTAYHPQANGMLERAHRQLKDALRSRLAGDRWPDHLPWVLLGLRAAPKDTRASLQRNCCTGFR